MKAILLALLVSTSAFADCSIEVIPSDPVIENFLTERGYTVVEAGATYAVSWYSLIAISEVGGVRDNNYFGKFIIHFDAPDARMIRQSIVMREDYNILSFTAGREVDAAYDTSEGDALQKRLKRAGLRKFSRILPDCSL